MNVMRVSLLTVVALTATVGSTPSSAARGRYDGSWSVSVITDKGVCDRAYRYRVRINNGKVTYDEPNGPQISISGRVNPRGQINVTVGRGEQRATGNGRLSGDSGTGRWSGKSSSQACSGRWEAERRE